MFDRRPALALFCLLGTSALGYELHHDKTGEVTRWGSELKFITSPHLDESLKMTGSLEALQAAAREWSRTAPALKVSVEPGEVAAIGYDGKSEIVSISDDWPYDPHVLASTIITINLKTHEIIEADIAINDDENDFGVLPAGSVRGGHLDDLQNAISHEMGHAVGLEHSMVQAQAVMYPAAWSGEINKRALSDDDQQGVAVLYPDVPVNAELPAPRVGCSLSGQPPVLLLALLIPLALRRRRWLAVGPALAASMVFAQEVTPGSALSTEPRAPMRCSGTVTASTAQPPEAGRFFTQVVVKVRQCDAGGAPREITLRVPGGVWGDLEQQVAGAPVPRVGDSVELVERPTREGLRFALSRSAR